MCDVDMTLLDDWDPRDPKHYLVTPGNDRDLLQREVASLVYGVIYQVKYYLPRVTVDALRHAEALLVGRPGKTTALRLVRGELARRVRGEGGSDAGAVPKAQRG